MRNLLTYFTRPVERIRRHVRARYDAIWTTGQRSYMPLVAQSAARDIGNDRQGLMSLARRWDQNSPLVCGVLERIATYTIGTGLIPIPASSSARWNKIVARAWDDWARRPEVSGRYSWGTMQRIVWRSGLRDGDCFLVLIDREESPDGEPKVQMIEAHRIREPNAPVGNGLEPRDGVVRDPAGRHVGYKLCRDDGSLERTLRGEAVVQVHLPIRPDQPRGVTIFASALKTVHNLDDILNLEQMAVKDSAAKTDIIKTATGELPIEDVVKLDEADVPPYSADAVGYYKDVFGPEAKVLKHGDEWTGYEPKRPSPAWQGFVEFLANSVVLSTGLPPAIVLPVKIGGADTRAMLAAAARVFECWQWAQADAYQFVYEFVVGSWIDSGKIGNAPKDWKRISWQMPRSITADAGRQTQADIDLVASGMMTLEQYFGEQGLVADEEIEKLATEQEKISKRDPTGQLSQRLYSKPGAAAAPPAQEQQDETQPENGERNGTPGGPENGDRRMEPALVD